MRRSELQTGRVGVFGEAGCEYVIVADQRMSTDRVAPEIRRSGEDYGGLQFVGERRGLFY